MLPRFTLRAKLLLGVLLILVPVLGLLLAGFQADYTQRRETVSDDLTKTAQLAAVVADSSFDEALALTQMLADDPVVQTLDSTQLDPYFERLARYRPDLNYLGVFDATGDERGAAVRLPEGRINIADRRYFQEALATGAPVLSEVLFGRVIRQPAVSAAASFPGSAGRPAGVAVVGLKVDALARRLASVGLGPGEAIFLVDRTGRIAFHTARSDLSWEARDVSAWPEVQAALAGQVVRKDTFTSPLLGDQQVAAFVPTPRHGWVVGVTWPASQAFGPLEQAHRRQLMAFGAIALVSTLGVALLATLLTAPILQLAVHARSLGRGDFGRRAVVRTGDELQELAETFNAMAERLQQAIERYQETAGRLEAVFSSMADGVYVYGADGRLVDVNPAGLALFGLRREDLGRPFVEYLNRLDFRHLDGSPVRPEETVIARALRGETLVSYEARFRKPSGEERLASVSGAPVHDEQGRVILAVGVVRDITESKGAEAERAHLAAIVESSDDAIISKTLDGIIVSWNPGAQRLYGYTAEEAIGRSASILIPPDRPAELPAILERLKRGERIEHDETVRVRKDGRRIDVSVTISPIKDAAGRIIGASTIARDITDRKRAEVERAHLLAQLQVALKLREEFIAAAAHELRTPITALKGYVGLLRRFPEVGGADVGKALGVIERSTDRVARLAQELMAATELERGDFSLQTERFDLAELAGQLVEDAQAEHPRHQFRLETVPAVVVADRERIGDVIRHLLASAVKYQPQGGAIEVAVGVEGSEAVLTVRDHGLSIPPERQPHVFEPMYEPIPSGTPGYVGVVGLGLAISQRIVEQHGGRIWFESAVGQGSTFHVALRLRA